MNRFALIIFSILGLAADPTVAGEPVIPVTVSAVTAPTHNFGEPISITVTVKNGLAGPVSFSTYGIEPNDWNGETVNLTLVDIYRDGKERGLYLASPAIEVPRLVAGMSAHRIETGGELTVTTDARKWGIDGGWKPGKYRVNVRVESLSVDDGRCVLAVTSEPFEFEVK